MKTNKDVPLEDVDPPEFYLASLNRQIRELMDYTLRPHGLKLVEWRLLQCLVEGRTLTICDLATLAVIERTVTSRMVDKLAKRDLVKKSTMLNDRRFMQVSLTAHGRRLLRATYDDVAAARTQLFAGLAQDQITMLQKILQQLQTNAQAVMLGRKKRV